MAKPKPNLAAVVDGIPDTPAPSVILTDDQPRRRRRDTTTEQAATVLVGANLPPRYARNLAMLHAETGRSKKELLQEALDMFFTAKGGAALKL